MRTLRTSRSKKCAPVSQNLPSVFAPSLVLGLVSSSLALCPIYSPAPSSSFLSYLDFIYLHLALISNNVFIKPTVINIVRPSVLTLASAVPPSCTNIFLAISCAASPCCRHSPNQFSLLNTLSFPQSRSLPFVSHYPSSFSYLPCYILYLVLKLCRINAFSRTGFFTLRLTAYHRNFLATGKQ